MVDNDRLADRLNAFKPACAELVDALVDGLTPKSRDALAAAIDAGGTLRLAVNVAPAFSIVLYVVNGDPPRFVTLAAYPSSETTPEPTAPGPIH